MGRGKGRGGIHEGRGRGRGGNHEGRVNNNSRSWTESIYEINHVPDTQDMAPMIQSQIPSVQPSPPSPAQAPQQFEIGSASASVAESINVEANIDGASRFDPRDVITIENRELLPHEKCSRMITKTFEQRLHKDGYTWKNIPQNTKDLYFEDFQKYFRWDQKISGIVKILWEKQAAIRYKSFIWTIKNAKQKPPYVSDDIWKAWNDEFNKPEYIARARQNKLNRQVGEPATHTGGSITHSSHAKLMEQSSGKKPTYYELFIRNHTKRGDGSFVNEKAKALNDDFIRLREEMSQPEEGSSEPRPIDDNEIFVKNVGGVKKSRLYGIGYEISAYCGIASFSCTSPATGHSHELEDKLQLMQEENKLLRDQFKDLQDQHQKIQEKNEKTQEEMRKQMQEEMCKQIQEMQRHMQEQMKSQLAAFFRGDNDQ